MVNNNGLHPGTTKRRALLSVVLTLVTHTALAAEPAAQRYNMTAFVDHAYGEALVAGDYAATIDALADRKVRKANRLPASNNLCVAYVLAKDIANAKQACEAAVKLAKHSPRGDKAITLTNRGVIRALTGEIAEAKEDFQAAIKLRKDLPEPLHNLTRLESTQAAAGNAFY